jgi:nicotinamide-nucleotide amidase
MQAEVIAIGDELVSGQRLDTNSRWLAAELGVLGIPVTFHTTAADTLEAGIEAFRLAAGRADVVVATGGLGPTADDLTRDVLARLANVPLVLSPAALAVIEARFAARGAPCPESNRRQAQFPEGSREIPNPDGTAPGIDLAITTAGRASRIFALPGVPSEMRTMWRASVGPALVAMLPEAATIVQRRVKCFGAGESAIEAMLPDLVRRGNDPLVGITAHEATITLRIAARGRDEAECGRMIAATEAVIRRCLGDLVFGVEDEELEDATLAAVAAAGATLAIGETGTAGAAAALAGRAAADRRAAGLPAGFVGGIVAPGDSADAAALARRSREAFAAEFGLGIGPALASDDGRPVVAIALATDAGVEHVTHVLAGEKRLAVSRAAKAALDLVRRRSTLAGVAGRTVG